MKHRFEGELIEGHGTLAILVPHEVVEQLGKAVRVFPRRFGYPVSARIGRKRFDAVILTRGLNAGLLIDEDQRRALGLELGQSVRVELERAAAPAKPG